MNVKGLIQKLEEVTEQGYGEAIVCITDEMGNFLNMSPEIETCGSDDHCHINLAFDPDDIASRDEALAGVLNKLSEMEKKLAELDSRTDNPPSSLRIVSVDYDGFTHARTIIDTDKLEEVAGIMDTIAAMNEASDPDAGLYEVALLDYDNEAVMVKAVYRAADCVAEPLFDVYCPAQGDLFSEFPIAALHDHTLHGLVISLIAVDKALDHAVDAIKAAYNLK